MVGMVHKAFLGPACREGWANHGKELYSKTLPKHVNQKKWVTGQDQEEKTSVKRTFSINLPNYPAHKGRAPSPSRQRQLAPFRFLLWGSQPGSLSPFYSWENRGRKSHRYFLRVESQGSQEWPHPLLGLNPSEAWWKSPKRDSGMVWKHDGGGRMKEPAAAPVLHSVMGVSGLLLTLQF